MSTSLGRARAELTALFDAIGPAGRARVAHALEPVLGLGPRGASGQRSEALVAALSRPGVPGAAALRELRRACPGELRRIDRVASACLPLPERVGRVAPSLPPLRRFQGLDDVLVKVHAALDRRSTVWIVGPPGSGRLSLMARIGRDRLAQHSLIWTVRGPDPARIDHDLAALALALGLAGEAEEARWWLEENDDWLIILVGCGPTVARVSGPGAVVCSAVVAPPQVLRGGGGPTVGELGSTAPEPRLRLAYSRPASPGAAQDPSVQWSADDAGGAIWFDGGEGALGQARGSDDVVVALDGPGPSALEGRLCAAIGVQPPLQQQMAALLGQLEPEERALLVALSALGAAPVNLNLFDAPRLDGAPPWMVPLLRSRFTVDGAARRLVGLEIARRDGGGLWLSEAARAAVVALVPPEAALDATLGALLSLNVADDPLPWLPHVHHLCGRLEASVRARLLGRCGRALAERQPARAQRYLGRALLGEHLLAEERASVQNDLGVLLRRAGDPAAARRLLLAALADEPPRGGDSAQAVAGLHYHLGLCEVDLGLSAEAEASFMQGCEALEGARPGLLSALLALRLGGLLMERGALDASAERLSRARRDLQRAGGSPMRGVELELLCAELAERRGQGEAALAHAERAWDLARGMAEGTTLRSSARALLERLDP